MEKTVQTCPRCSQPLSFREWSNRYEKGYIWQEALADCQYGCGKFGLRYFDGKPHSEVYQVKGPAQKTAHGSYRLNPEYKDAICAMYGSVQSALDSLGQVCITQQSKS